MQTIPGKDLNSSLLSFNFVLQLMARNVFIFKSNSTEAKRKRFYKKSKHYSKNVGKQHSTMSDVEDYYLT